MHVLHTNSPLTAFPTSCLLRQRAYLHDLYCCSGLLAIANERSLSNIGSGKIHAGQELPEAAIRSLLPMACV